MRYLVLLVSFVLAIGFGGDARAQERIWVQIEAQELLSDAMDRARAYAAAFPDVAGFQMESGWYAIALGPYTPEGAEARREVLRADNLIPADSYLVGGAAYRRSFWPVGQNGFDAPILPSPVNPVLGATPPPPVTETTLPPVPPETAPVIEAPELTPEPTLAPADETPAQARTSEAALSRDDRMALQTALKEFGFYDSGIDGAFGPGTRASMAAWQEANGYEATGILTTAQRAKLLAEKERIRAELDLQTITEPEAGIEILLPMALVEFDHYEPPFVHFSAKDGGDLRVVLISQPGDRRSLSALYDVIQTFADVPRNGERSLDARSFRIEGANDRIAAHAYAELSQGLIKGYMLFWNPSDPAKAQRALTAMQSSFRATGNRALDPGLVPLDDVQRNGLLAGMEVRRPTVSRSGFYITDKGVVLTTTEVLQSCTRITLDRDTEADVTLRDDTMGFALLTPRKTLSPRHIAMLETKTTRAGTEIAVSGYAYEDALPSPTLTFGTLADTKGLGGEETLNRLALSVLPGDTGGPVIDGSGAVLGMLLPRAGSDGRVLPNDVAFLATSASLVPKLTEAGIVPQPAATSGALAPEDLTNLASDMTVLVSCWQ